MRIVEVSKDDYQFLYEMLCERDPVENITHARIPDYDEHVRFVDSNPYSKWYIVYLDDEKIGTVYLSKQDEVGIFLKKKYQSKGIGKSALDLLIEKNPRNKYYANVNPKNSKSIQFFENFGFKLMQNTYELSRSG